jgi:radical SAM-linked protein
MKFTNIRVFFSKSGDAKYISHLDLYRAFGRVIKRSGLPVWYTEGFNPHIYLTFALPLALGIESEEESFDLRLTQDFEFDGESFVAIADRLNSVMPKDLRVTRVGIPIRNANEIEKAWYRVNAENPDTLNAYFAREQINIIKKSKSKTQELDVKPLLTWESGSQTLSLPAGNVLNINPWNVLTGLEVISATRIAILCADGSLFA